MRVAHLSALADPGALCSCWLTPAGRVAPMRSGWLCFVKFWLFPDSSVKIYYSIGSAITACLWGEGGIDYQLLVIFFAGPVTRAVNQVEVGGGGRAEDALQDGIAGAAGRVQIGLDIGNDKLQRGRSEERR